MSKKLTLSLHPKTWLIDIDGIIFEHNSHLTGKDKLIVRAKEFIESLPSSDFIILLTARSTIYEGATTRALNEFGVRYDHIIFGLPKGERVLINDTKPKGLQTAIAINTERDNFAIPDIYYSKKL